MSSADFNAFGRDPHGLRAHCFAAIYGPDYIPETSKHIRFFKGKIYPPRYGAPSLQQIPWLPAGWKPTIPPPYYGIPSPPFLPKPSVFNPNLFKALESKRSATILNPIDCIMNPEITNDEFSIRVTDGSSNVSKHFSVLTNVEWEDFEEKAFAHIGAGRDNQSFLGYRQFHGVYTYDQLEDFTSHYGPLRPLAGAEDWEKAIIDLRKAGQEGFDVEMEIVRLTARRVESLNRREDAKTLPMVGLQVKTYYFMYPPVEELLEMLGGSLETQLVGFRGRDQIVDILKRAGFEYLDDFSMHSPYSLHFHDGIPADAVRLLFSGAEEMLRAFHWGMDEVIRDIEEMTRK